MVTAVRRWPSTLIIPLILLTALLAGGIYGVIRGSQAEEDRAITAAHLAAKDAAISFRLQLSAAWASTASLAEIIRITPDCKTFLTSFLTERFSDSSYKLISPFPLLTRVFLGGNTA